MSSEDDPSETFSMFSFLTEQGGEQYHDQDHEVHHEL
jgi:hypothetical protein